MSQTLEVEVEQVGPSTAKALARTHGVFVDRPVAKGGADQGPQGGEYLLISLGGCFMSNLLAAIRTREAAVSDVRITVSGALDGAPTRFTQFTINISARHTDSTLARKLITIADRGCIVTNTLRQTAPVTVLFEGSTVESSAVEASA